MDRKISLRSSVWPTLLFALLAARAAPALDQTYAYTVVDDPFSVYSTPHPDLTYNHASEDPVTVTRSGPGQYAVHFPDFDALAGGGNVQVSQAFGTGHCQIDSWTADTVNVRCYDSSGTYADQLFRVLFLKSQPGATAAFYAWASSTTLTEYSPASYYAFHPGGGAVTATRLGVGSYAMEWEDAGAFGVDGGHVQVTAYGSAPRSCHVSSWLTSQVFVQCYDASGAPADSRYSVLYLRPEPGDPAALAFSWANEKTSPFYPPDPFYAWNSADEAVTIQRDATGYYHVHFPGFADQGGDEIGHVQVSSYGPGAVDCDTPSVGWDTVTVECLDAAGSPVDSQFDLLYLRPLPEPQSLAGLTSCLALLTGLARRRTARLSRRRAGCPRWRDSAPRTAGSLRASG